MVDKRSYTEELRKLRQAVDEVDQKLVALFNERARLAQRIGVLKREAEEAPFDPQREEEVLKRVGELSTGPLKPQEVRALFVHLIRICRSLEQEGRIAYLGPPGTFSHQALLLWFGGRVETVPCRDLPEIAAQLRSRAVDLALFPVENTTEGIIGPTYDLVAEQGFRIVLELVLPIHIYLIGRVPLKEAQRLYSHIQPLRQAHTFLERNLRHAEWIETRSSAEACERLREDPQGVALVSPLLAESGEFPILAGPIESSPDNETRFWVVDRGETPRTQKGEKSTLYFILPHRPGTLAHFLNRLAEKGVNLTSIVSRPFAGRSWEYRFFVDLVGDAGEEPLRSLLPSLEGDTVELKVLGSYRSYSLKGEDRGKGESSS